MPEQVEKVQVRPTTNRAVTSRLEICDLDNRLPISSAELDAIERLLGADLTALLNS
jgi:hypothetical protein